MAQLDGNAKAVKMLINSNLQNNINGSGVEGLFLNFLIEFSLKFGINSSPNNPKDSSARSYRLPRNDECSMN